MVWSDGIFSMEGAIAPLPDLLQICRDHDAILVIDDSHATGVLGKTGRGTHEYRGAMGRVDIITGTLGKALGGASGGFTASNKEVVEILRQRSRPYLFSNTLAPAIVGASIAVFDLLTESTRLRDRLEKNTRFFRRSMKKVGFNILPGEHPIVPIMLFDARVAQEMAARLLDEGIYVIGFFFPVVPQGKARIRVQISAGHTRAHLEKAVAAFTKVGREMGVLKK